MANADLVGFTQPEAAVIGQIIASQVGGRTDVVRTAGAKDDTPLVGRLAFIVGLARWLRRSGVEATTPITVLAPPGVLIAILPPGIPLMRDEWREGLNRVCRRYFDREFQVASVGE
jgi:hypothetical protein